MGVHGGDVYRNVVGWDFSVNVNPFGVPEAVEMAVRDAVSVCGRYPDAEAEGLKRAVGGMLKVPEEYLLFGNGASELFMAAVHGIKPKKVVIPVPSFYGYEYAAKAAGGEIAYCVWKEEDGFSGLDGVYEALDAEAELLFLANPNNPTGYLAGKGELRRLLEYCGERGIYVVLDECFIEFCEGEFSMLSEIGEWGHVMLVRAFTKIFAIPGVRLGYLVCSSRETLGRVARQLPEWNLSCFAQAAGCACAKQADFIGETVRKIRQEREFLGEGLRKKGIRVFPSAANFFLVYSEEPLYDRLLEKGVLIRDCSNFRGLRRGFYRIAVKDRKENERLLEALECL